MLQIVLVRPGSTDFDEQGRIKGTLNLPLSEKGVGQVARTVRELAQRQIEVIYTAPCQAAQQTAETLAQGRHVKVKPLDKLKNLNHGLWHGKLIDEVKYKQPKVYRRWQDHPDTVCPPEGETLASAQQRVRETLSKLLKKHPSGLVALVVSEPLASLVQSELENTDLGDLWKAECRCGSWSLIEIEPQKAVLTR